MFLSALQQVTLSSSLHKSDTKWMKDYGVICQTCCNTHTKAPQTTSKLTDRHIQGWTNTQVTYGLLFLSLGEYVIQTLGSV